MKIFFVLRNLANVGGVERTLTDKANYMAEKGHDVTFVTYEQGQHPNAFVLLSSVKRVDLNCRRFALYQLPWYKHIIKYVKMKYHFRRKWNELVDSEKPDVVVVTTYTQDFMHELMTVNEKTRIIVESHTAFTHDMHSDRFLKKILIVRMLRDLKKSSLLITLTEGDASCWRKYVKNVKRVPNPVTFYPESIDNVKKDTGRIISVGRLHEQKRYDRLINAFALIADNYPEWHIHIFGNGELKEQLNHQINGLHLDNQIVIHSPSNDIMTEFLRSQFFVLSSDYEGLPLVLLEAMACGLPVVSTNCPFGPADIIDESVGMLSDLNVNDLAEKIAWFINHPEDRKEKGQNAHLLAASYKKDDVLKLWEDSYCSVI
jgi:glycosyltransferase involved in cell wall biosynthesis